MGVLKGTHIVETQDGPQLIAKSVISPEELGIDGRETKWACQSSPTLRFKKELWAYISSG